MLKGAVAAAVRAAYHVFELFPQKRIIAFLSRQAAHPFDFRLLEGELAARFPDYEIRWACVEHIGELGVGLFLQQLKLVATARICLVDGYVPAVSIPKRHRSTCIQVWHAVGAVKKFGYQCLDTPAGRTSADARAYRMHRGYDYVIAGMPGAVPAFVEAFDAPAETIEVMGLPRLDYLVGKAHAARRREDAARVRRQLGIKPDDGRTVVLYAPTLRRSNVAADWLERNVRTLAAAFAGKPVLLVVAGHPLDEVSRELEQIPDTDVAVLHGPTIEALGCVDVVVSDYSAVALEAGFAGKPVAFFVPDIEEYRVSPGVNIDPLEAFPGEAFTDGDALADALFPDGRFAYASPSFAAFMRDYAAGVSDAAVTQIADLVSGIIS